MGTGDNSSVGSDLPEPKRKQLVPQSQVVLLDQESQSGGQDHATTSQLAMEIPEAEKEEGRGKLGTVVEQDAGGGAGNEIKTKQGDASGGKKVDVTGVDDYPRKRRRFEEVGEPSSAVVIKAEEKVVIEMPNQPDVRREGYRSSSPLAVADPPKSPEKTDAEAGLLGGRERGLSMDLNEQLLWEGVLERSSSSSSSSTAAIGFDLNLPPPPEAEEGIAQAGGYWYFQK